MKYYQEILFFPTLDINLYFLWQKVYQQMHLALVENKNPDNTSSIGISFPEYDERNYFLGRKICLFAELEHSLEALNAQRWLQRITDYIRIGEIKAVPEKVYGHACFKHIKLKGNKGKLARRRAKRKEESFEQALAYYSGYEEEQSKLPFINMISQTNGQHFRIYIEKQNFDMPREGFFSFYGLSNKSTVPLF